MIIYCRIYKCVKFVRGMSSARWMIRVAVVGRVVDGCSWTIVAGSWCQLSRRSAAGRSLRVADVGRIVDVCSWTIVAGSWCRSRLVNRYPGFDSTLDCPAGSMKLLARTASRTWARCCNAKAVCTASRTRTSCCIAGASWSKSVLAAWSRRVKWAWWLRLNRLLVLWTKWTDRETVAKVCQALAHKKLSEQIGEARAL